MQGRLFTWFDIPFPSYFVLLLTGFVFATAAGAVWAKRIGQNPDVVVDLGIAMLLAGVAGARLLHVLADGYFWDYVHLCTDPSLVEWKITRAECLRPIEASFLDCQHDPSQTLGVWNEAKQVCQPREADCFAWAKFWSGGLTYYGGFLGASVAAWFLLKADRFPFWKASDMAGMVVPIGLGFGRMGCLLAGCCFGAPTGLPWAVSFPPNSPASEAQHRLGLLASPFEASLPVHPTQVYESAACFAIAALLLLHLHGRKRYDGQIFLAFVALYAAVRFVLEFWRRDDRGGLLGLSTSQLIGLLLIGAAFAVHRARLRRLQPAEASTSGSAPG
ncbi:MAG TPA: prolipoprotein diacylglyceryl transferase [Polyangiaceae bacterium]|nr:prolipoprotein diacylglyceryl transferase [Polyangiaceae bacterium]